MRGALARIFPVGPEPTLIVEQCLQSLQGEIRNLAASVTDQADTYIFAVLCQEKQWEDCFYSTFLSPAVIDRLTVIIRTTLERETGYPALSLATEQIRPDWLDVSGEITALRPVIERGTQLMRLTAFSEAVQQWACRQVVQDSCPLPLYEMAVELAQPVARESIKQQIDMEWRYLQRCVRGLAGQIWRRLEYNSCRRVAELLYRWHETRHWDEVAIPGKRAMIAPGLPVPAKQPAG